MDELDRWHQLANVLEAEATEVESLSERIRVARERIEKAITEIEQDKQAILNHRKDLRKLPAMWQKQQEKWLG